MSPYGYHSANGFGLGSKRGTYLPELTCLRDLPFSPWNKKIRPASNGRKRAGKMGTGEQLLESPIAAVTIYIAIVIQSFADRGVDRSIRRHGRPNDSRRIDFFDDFHGIDASGADGCYCQSGSDLVKKAEVARAYPKLFAIPRQRLRRDRGRRKTLSLFDCRKVHYAPTISLRLLA